MDHYQHNDAGEWATRADAEYKWLDNSFLKSFRFGARYTDKEAITRETGYNWGLLSSLHGLEWCGCAVPITGSQFQGNSTQVGFNNFFRGNNPTIPGTWFPSASLVGQGPIDAFETLKNARSMTWSWTPLGPNAYLNKTPATDNVSGRYQRPAGKDLCRLWPAAVRHGQWHPWPFRRQYRVALRPD